MTVASRMNARPVRPSRWCLPSLCMALLAACGGGEGGSGVTSLQASPLAFSRNATVSVSGSGLDQDGLRLEAEGPCNNVARVGNPSPTQAQFSCLVEGTGPIVFRVRQGNGAELARLTVSVPLPQVTMQVRLGGRSGSFVVELDPGAAPVTTRNFLGYVNSGFYANTLLHRVLANKLVQGGGFETGLDAKAPTQQPIPLESANGLKNVRGTIAMARTSAPDSATSQFYLNLADNPEFDRVSDAAPGYAVFGRVVAGQNIIDDIGAVTTTDFTNSRGEFFQGLPQTEVVISAAAQTR